MISDFVVFSMAEQGSSVKFNDTFSLKNAVHSSLLQLYLGCVQVKDGSQFKYGAMHSLVAQSNDVLT